MEAWEPRPIPPGQLVGPSFYHRQPENTGSRSFRLVISTKDSFCFLYCLRNVFHLLPQTGLLPLALSGLFLTFLETSGTPSSGPVLLPPVRCFIAAPSLVPDFSSSHVAGDRTPQRWNCSFRSAHSLGTGTPTAAPTDGALAGQRLTHCLAVDASPQTPPRDSWCDQGSSPELSPSCSLPCIPVFPECTGLFLARGFPFAWLAPSGS